MVKPVLQAMVLADRVYRDADTGKFLIIGTFGKVMVKLSRPEPPDGGVTVVTSEQVADAGTPSLYLAMTDIHGTVDLTLRFVHLVTHEAYFEGGVQLRADDPLKLCEAALGLPRLTAEPGRYSLDLLWNEELIGQWRIEVVREESTP
jgi:hypothetical protein